MKIKVKDLEQLIKEFGQKPNWDIKTNPLIEAEHLDAVAWQLIELKKEIKPKDWISDGVIDLHDLVKVENKYGHYIHFDAIQYIETDWGVKLTPEQYKNVSKVQ